MKPLKSPLYITKPLLADLNLFQHELQDVWESGWLTNNGFKHQKLEKILRDEVLRVPNVSLVTNATLGLLGVLKTLDLKGEIITTPFTFPATAHAITWAGLKPVFCDIDPSTMNIDPCRIEASITKNTSAILAVHVFGQPCDVDAVEKIAQKYHLKVIYDAAHAFELELNHKSVASFGDASVFSFHATKLFHTGEGGAVVFSRNSEKEKFDVLKNFGIKEEEILSCGLNFKMSELQAALGLVVLEVREKERSERARVKKIYENSLSQIEGVILPIQNQQVTRESLQYFAVRISEKDFGTSRDIVWKKLKDRNIHTRRYFYPLCTEYPHYKQVDSRKVLPIAYRVVDEVLCLPFYGSITDNEAHFVCEAIESLRRGT